MNESLLTEESPYTLTPLNFGCVSEHGFHRSFIIIFQSGFGLFFAIFINSFLCLAVDLFIYYKESCFFSFMSIVYI